MPLDQGVFRAKVRVSASRICSRPAARGNFATTQLGNVSIFEFVSTNMDQENWTKYVRVPVEADG